jgi:hypothetical protein
MKIMISDEKVGLNEQERQNICHRVLFSLGRFAWHLDDVTLYLTRDNEQNGGRFRCLIYGRAANRVPYVVHGSARGWAGAVSQAADRLEWRLTAGLPRLRGRGRDALVKSLAAAWQPLRKLAGRRKQQGYLQ